jgi:4-hydroxyproline epimerase
MKTIKVIDSHTGGEPTRIIVDGGPDLGGGPLDERVKIFREKFDDVRSAVINEPRGSDVMVGGLLCRPTGDSFTAAVIFFDTAGFLGMCGHGTIGLMVTLRHLGHIDTGVHRIQTPVGPITATLNDDHHVSVQNVPSYRAQSNVKIEVPGYGQVVGDIAWGGNWFYCVSDHCEELTLSNVDRLTQITRLIRDELGKRGITGDGGHPVDHIELYGPPTSAAADSKNFVLCPSGTYDRSPCGTGTSAKMACLAAEGKLRPGQMWRQESIVGSIFEGSVVKVGDRYLPTIRGTAYVSGESTLILDPSDPFVSGIPKSGPCK